MFICLREKEGEQEGERETEIFYTVVTLQMCETAGAGLNANAGLPYGWQDPPDA